jgi:cytochrome P450
VSLLQPCKYDSLNISRKTVVSVPTWTTHRNPQYFPHPEAFQPQRWLDVYGGTEEMKKLYMPFSKGARACIGQAMALLELRLTTATLIKRYVVMVNKDLNLVDMDFGDHFVMIPKGEACLLDFTPVK